MNQVISSAFSVLELYTYIHNIHEGSVSPSLNIRMHDNSATKDFVN